MFVFNNILMVMIIVIIITRVSNFYFSKYIKEKKNVLSATYIGIGTLTCFGFCFFVGFDVVITEYVGAFMCLFIFDLIRIEND